MEATLQKSKSKKHRTKSKQTQRPELECNINLAHDNTIRSEEIEDFRHAEEEKAIVNLRDPPEIKSPTALVKETIVKNAFEQKNADDISQNSKQISKSVELNKLLEKVSEEEKNYVIYGETLKAMSNADNMSTQVSERSANDVVSSSEIIKSEKMPVIFQKEVDVMKIQSLHIYPDLKCLQYCEQMHNLASSQTLVKTYAEEYKHKIAMEANKGFQDFSKVLQGLDNHPLTEMVHQYQRAKKSSLQLCSRIKYLKSDLKRKKDSLWISVRKEAFAKGKCGDGYTINVKHPFTIKELNQEKFNEVKSILKEIEELLSSHAFHSYSEEVTKLRIEHYIHGLLESENPEEFQESFSSGLPENESALLIYKKCISILFDSQRQNVQDRHYLNTCQKWLKTMVSKLMQSGNFEDNLFVINHVIRCPNGIQNWAAELVQVPVTLNNANENEVLEDICAQQILLSLFLILKPVPLRDFFLKNIKHSTLGDPVDGNFIVLDSEGEEEDLFEISKNWCDADIVSLLHQIPVRSLYKHFLLINTGDLEIKQKTENRMLKLFAYSSAIIDFLFDGLQTYSSENFPLLFESISNLIRHILLYVSEYWIHLNMSDHVKSQLQAVYDKLFFHIIYKIYNFDQLHIWKILPSLPYDFVSEKMLWNIMWIFFSPGKSEEQIYSEKDVELKIQDETIHSVFVNHITKLSVEDIIQLVYCVEKIITSNKSSSDLREFTYYMLFKISVLESSLMKILFKEGSIILRSISKRYPYLVSLLLSKIDESGDEVVHNCIDLFKKMNLLNWIPGDNDMHILSSWLHSHLTGKQNHLARLILKNMNWNFSSKGLFLSSDLHKRVAVLVSEAYLKFDANNNNEGLISKGVKQILQFTSIGGQREEEEFFLWAWNILFCLKLHPLDSKNPPWIEVYDGCVEDWDKPDVNSDVFQSLLTAYETKHPCSCYLMLVIEGHSVKNLLNRGLECFSTLVESEQYMAAIKSLYYILPFFVKNSEQLLEKFGFIRAMSYLVTADLTVLSNITGEPVIGVVLHHIAAMIKYQIYQAGEQIIECAVPLIKLWIKILMKMLSPSDKNLANVLKNSAKQLHFLLDVIVKISFLNDYTRDCTLDLFANYCSSVALPKTPQSSRWNIFFYSNPCIYPILNLHTIPEYPWLAWYVLLSEIKQKNAQDLWQKVQIEMSKQSENSPASCLKKVLDNAKVDLDTLPIYRWALQAVKTPVSHPVSPLIWQQFFLYYFHKVPLPNSESFVSNGIKYFSSGPYVALFHKIKKHLGDALTFYRNLLKTSESERIQSLENSKSFKNENGQFYKNLQTLFLAFQLWIDDELLQNPELCLSALEPKYCPYRLKLILNGDQNIWYDMVSNAVLKDEIDQKIHSWCFKEIPNEVVKICSTTEETLPEKISRHLMNYESTQPAVCLNNIPIFAAAYEINNFGYLSSKETIVQFIEQKQSIIFDIAKHFCEQMKHLKQLNFNFINWVPQEYEVEDSEVIEMKACSSGCRELAHFRLQIQIYKVNERISERIDNNRAEYLIIQDQLSKLPVKDLCIASLHIENLIRSLACKMKNAKNGDADCFRKTGIGLFYHQIATIDKTITSVAGYPASRQFFSSIIESLGREFIEGNEYELKDLSKAILNHPESGSLALPLFDPNKSGITNFMRVYETLTSAVGKYSASTLLALFSKVDFSHWLNKNTPNFDDRKTIFKYICDALLVCGHSPSSELLHLFFILKRHFGIILQYMFPELLLLTVDFLLNGAECKKLSCDIYYEAFHCFGFPLFSDKTNADDIEVALKKFAQNQQLSADQQIFVSVAQFNFQQVNHISQHFYSYFMTKRSSCVLYKQYATYVKPLGIFLGIISHSVIVLYLDEMSTLKQAICLKDLWEIFHLSFWPWLHPFVNGSCGLDFPWSDEELENAHYLFKIFTASLKYFHEQFLGHIDEESVLSYMWNFYVQNYVVPGYRHYSVYLCHTELLNLPWHQFYPSTHAIEGMCKVLQSNLDESKDFLSKLSLKIPWSEVMQKISSTKPPVYVGKVLATLGKLLIISQLNCTETEIFVSLEIHLHTNYNNLELAKFYDNNSYPNVFKEFETLSWHFLSMEEIEVLLNLFYSSADIFLLVSNWGNSVEFYALQFLKLICCMVPNPEAGEYSNSKRILYLQKFFSALSACCSFNKDQIQKLLHHLKDVISSLCEEINIVICNGINPNDQTNYALPLVKEIVTFLNNLPVGVLDLAALNSIVLWLSVNKQSPLLFPFLKVSSQNLNSVSHMVPLIECCISTRFNDEVLDLHEALSRWHMISSYFCVRPNVFDEFVKTCVEENAYLTLYCCLLHRLPRCNSTENRKILLERIIQWIRESKLRLDAEAKFILIWDKLFDLSYKLALEEEFMVVRQELTSFCWILDTLAEDRSNSGFLSIIGFGQASSLSVNFRFLCRVMAAFIQNQIPSNRPIRMEPSDSDCMNESGSSISQESSNATSASKALDNLRALQQKKLYSALLPQIDYAVKCISDPTYTFQQTRELLKYFAVVLYPKDSYLSALDS